MLNGAVIMKLDVAKFGIRIKGQCGIVAIVLPVARGYRKHADAGIMSVSARDTIDLCRFAKLARPLVLRQNY